MNKVYEVILLVRAESVANDRHLAMRRQLHRTGQATCLYRSVADPFEHERATLLEVLISGYQEDRLWHKVSVRRAR